MATIIRIKRSSTTNAPSTLATGEIAYSYGLGTQANGGDRLYFGKGDDGTGTATSVVPIGGEYFTNLFDHVHGTLTASSAIITDANSKIDQLLVDNITIDGNTISTSTGNLTLNPNGFIDVNSNTISNVADPTLNQDAATKKYVDDNVGATDLTIIGDTGTDTVNMKDSDLTFVGDTGITTTVTDNTVTIDLDDTTVTPGSYGSQTAIPTFTVDQQGRLTAASTVTVGTTLNLAGDSSTTGNVSLLDSDLTFVGDTGITVTVSDYSVTVDLDDTTVTAGSYGSQTAIPTFTVDQQGRLTAAGTVAVGTTFTVNGDPISLLDSDLTFTDGEGLDISYDSATNTVTFSGEDATTTNKGIASFATADFNVTSGAVELNDAVVKAVTTDTGVMTPSAHGFSVLGGEGMDVTHAGTSITVAGEDASDTNKGIASFDATDFTVTLGDVVANPIMLGTTELNLGETDSDIAGLNSIEVGDIRISNNIISTLPGQGTLVLDPSPVGDSSGGYAGDVILRGNLTVEGVTTTVNSTTVSINDKNIVLADSATGPAPADGAGLTVGGSLYTGTKATILYDGALDRWDFNKPLDIGFASLDSAVFLGGVSLQEKIEDHMFNFFQQGEGIDIVYDDGAGTLTFSGEDATVTNKGIASFGGMAESDGGSTRQFTLTSGDVRITNIDGGTY